MRRNPGPAWRPGKKGIDRGARGAVKRGDRPSPPGESAWTGAASTCTLHAMAIPNRPGRANHIPDWLAVGVGGIVGTLLRAGSLLLAAPFPGWDPWVTAGGNLLGALLLGVFAGAVARRAPPGSPAQLFLTTGVLGSYTTFSALTIDVFRFADGGTATTASLYLLLSIPGGLAAAVVGLAAGRILPIPASR